MKINKISEVTIELPLFVTFKTSCIDEVIRMDVLMGNNVLGLAVNVTWGLNITDL